jgi:hypothetical protein
MFHFDNYDSIWISILAIITILVLLGAAIFLTLEFVICDHGTCHAFTSAEDIGDKHSKEYVIKVLSNLANDSCWSLPVIGSSIISLLILWLLRIKFSVREYALVFLLVFIMSYVIMNFLIHHYIKPIARYVIKFLEKFDESEIESEIESF